MKVLLFLLLLPMVVYSQRSYVQYWSTKYTRNTEGDIHIQPNGNIISIFTRFYGGATDISGSELFMNISIDGGKYWKPYNLAQSNIGKQNTMSVSTLFYQDSLLLFFDVKNSNSDLHIWYKKSGDNGQTWTSPRKVTPGSGNGSGYWILANNRAVKLSNGRICLPTSWANDVGNVGTSEGLRCRTIYSDDGGITWSSSNDVQLITMSRGWAEPVVVEIGAGVLHMYGRVQSGGRQYRSISTDNGQTWGPATQSTLISPEAPVNIIKMSDGRLLAAHCNNQVNQIRRPLVLSTSVDNGATWVQSRVLGNNSISWFTYPSLLEKDGFIYTTYWEQITSKNVFSLVFHKVPLSDLN